MQSVLFDHKRTHTRTDESTEYRTDVHALYKRPQKTPIRNSRMGVSPGRNALAPTFLFDVVHEALHGVECRSRTPVGVENAERCLLVEWLILGTPQDGKVHIPEEHIAQPR